MQFTPFGSGGVLPLNSEPVDAACRVLERVCEVGMRSIDGLSVRRDDPNQVHPAILYSSILELAVGILALPDRKALAGIPVLLRSAIEVYADFLVVLKDTGNYHYIHANYLREQQRYFKNAETDDGLGGVREMPEYITRRAEIDRELREYKDAGISPLTVKERMDLAGLGEMYNSTYWLLSNATHSNLTELSARHVRHEDEIIAIEAFSPIFHQAAHEHLVVTIALMIEATEKMQVHFGLAEDLGLAGAHQEFLELQEKYPPRT